MSSLIANQPYTARYRGGIKQLALYLAQHRNKTLKAIAEYISPDLVYDVMKEIARTRAPIGITCHILFSNISTHLQKTRKLPPVNTFCAVVDSQWMDIIADAPDSEVSSLLSLDRSDSQSL